MFSNIQCNTSGLNLDDYSDKEENTCQGNTLVAQYLWNPFSASLSDETPKKSLLSGVDKLHKNKNLLDIFEIVCDYEAAAEVLFQKLFVGQKGKLGGMSDYVDASFRLQGLHGVHVC